MPCGITNGVTCSLCEGKKCKFSISYLEGSSLSGFYFQDFAILGKNTTNFNVLKSKSIFGCTLKETGLFYSQLADGIIGLSPYTGKGSRFSNLVDDLFSQHGDPLEFSICYSWHDGLMSIGGYNKDLHAKNESTYSVPYIDNTYYTIKMKGVKVN